MAKPASVDDYLKSVPADQRTALQNLRKLIFATVPNVQELISWSMPSYKYAGKLLVGFAAFNQHCSLFTCSGTFLQAYQKEVEKYGGTKSCLHFTPAMPLPATLVKKILKERMKENELKAAGKKKPAKKAAVKK